MTTPADQPTTPLTTKERRTADDLLTRACCPHPHPTDLSTPADKDRLLLCIECGERWWEA